MDLMASLNRDPGLFQNLSRFLAKNFAYAFSDDVPGELRKNAVLIILLN